MRSQAALSISSPPRTACSASMECGGVRTAASCGSSGWFTGLDGAQGTGRRGPSLYKRQRLELHAVVPWKATTAARGPPLRWMGPCGGSGLLAHHGHLDFRHDIRVQRDADRMLADSLQRALRHADLCLVDLETLL